MCLPLYLAVCICHHLYIGSRLYFFNKLGLHHGSVLLKGGLDLQKYCMSASIMLVLSNFICFSLSVLVVGKKGRVRNRAFLARTHLTVIFAICLPLSNVHKYLHRLVNSRKKSGRQSVWTVPPPRMIVRVSHPHCLLRRKLRKKSPLPSLRSQLLLLLQMIGYQHWIRNGQNALID